MMRMDSSRLPTAKDIIITANGKNVAPQKIESRLGQDYYVEQVVVIGDKQKYLTALVVPSFPALEEYAQDKGITYEKHEDLVKKPEIIQLYRERIDNHSHDLADFEKKKVHRAGSSLDHRTNEITPTLKVKRRVIAERYKDIINQMYAS